MKKAIALLLLCAISVFGQAPPVLRSPFSTNEFLNLRVVTPSMSAAAITNIVGTAPPWTLIDFQQNATNYLIPTNQFSWRLPQVAFRIPRGTGLTVGTPGDSTIRAALFGDTTGARTNWIFGGGSIHMLQNSCIVTQENAGSEIYIELHDITATYALGEPMMTLKAGNWHLEWTGRFGGGSYDTLIGGPTDAGWTHLRGHFMHASVSGGQAIEWATVQGDPLKNIWQIDYIYPDFDASGELVLLAGGITLKDTHIHLATNAVAIVGMYGKNGYWDNVRVTGVSNLLTAVAGSGGAMTFRDCTFSNINSATVPIRLGGGTAEVYEFRDSEIITPAYASITNSGAITLLAKGLEINKPIATTITPLGWGLRTNYVIEYESATPPQTARTNSIESFALDNGTGTTAPHYVDDVGLTRRIIGDLVFTNVTTDATVTTLGSITLPNNTANRIDAYVVGYHTAFGNMAGYKRDATFACTNSTASLIGSVNTTGGSSEHNSAWDFTMDASGQTARLRVTGVAGQTIKWTGYVQVRQQGF